MERVQVASDGLTLKEALTPVARRDEKVSITTTRGSTTQLLDDAKTLSELGLKHGSLIQLSSTTGAKPLIKKTLTKKVKTEETKKERFDPFPDLAKDYEAVLRKTKAKRGGMSYGTLASLQEALHTVEPQQEGKLKRIYMCRVSAERFQSNGITVNKKKKRQDISARVGLLLGTIQRERVDTKPKPRTSLSSISEDQEYCQVAKVHAVWEPPNQHSTAKAYDASGLHSLYSKYPNVLKVASSLGLQPVGWIFSYVDDDNKRTDGDALPVFAGDISTGALLQIEKMKQHAGNKNNELELDANGSRFVTLAMDAKTGATEAFQLSDVSVQIIAEDTFVLTEKTCRHVKTKHPVLIDGRETTELDSVLCLVNMALLSHTGSFAADSNTVKKKNGSLARKTRKALLSALSEKKSDSLLKLLCDFNTLLALDDVLSPQDSLELCSTVRRWARGQRKTTVISDRLQERLHRLLEQYN
jgi:hypothetical protein